MLADDFVRFAERHYAVNWAAVQQRLIGEMPFLPRLAGILCDPLAFPSYWCLPILLGDHVGASKPAILADTAGFLRACLVRHFAFACADMLESSPACALHRLTMRSYRSSALAHMPAGASIEERLVRKCSPWMLTMSLGTRAIEAERGSSAAYLTAWRAILRTFLCVQIIDDWNDQAEDKERGLWNLWMHDTRADLPAALPRLLEIAARSLDALGPHFLARALEAQIADTKHELAAILARRRDRPVVVTADDV